MHVPIDKSWQYEIVAVGDRRRGRRWRALTDRGDGFTAHRDVALAQNRVGGDDCAGDYPVEWS